MSDQNPTVNIALDIDALFVESPQLDGDPVDVRTLMRTAVVDAAASKLIAGFNYEELHELRQEVHRVRNELVRERLVQEINAAFELPIQRTTQWGEKRGEVVTVRELIRIELEAFLSGTKTNRRHDSYDQTPNNLAELIGQVANETMRGPFADTVREARKVVAARVQEVLTEKVTKELAKPR